MQFTPNNKLASLGTIGLLFLAGIAGMVFLLPASPAHAAGPTVTLSTLSSGVLTAVTSATVATTIVIEGFGFAPATPITIITTVGTTTVQWLTQQSCATTNGGVGTINSLVTGTTSPPGVTGCLVTAAVGNFAVQLNVPNLPGGAQTVTVSDGTVTGTATLTITPKVSISYTGNNFGFPEETVTPTITVTGFASGEAVSGSTTAFTAAQTSYACTAGTSVGTYGSCTLYGPTATTIADTTGGSKTFTATGATSGLTATATITVNPWAAFYNSNNEQTTFSFIGTAPTSLLVEAHGMPAATIAANSITIGGTATNHASVTVGASGAFYGLVVSPASNVPFGLVSAAVGGTTFNYASGNIAQTVNNAVSGTNVWGGALISSITGTAGSTGVATTDQSSYKPGSPTTLSTTSPVPQQNLIGFFGYGFCPSAVTCAGAGGALTISTPAGAAYCTTSACTATGATPSFATGNGGGSTHADANGAFFATAILGDTPWSAVATPTTAASYTATVVQAASAPANVLSPSFGISPWIDTTKGGIFQGVSTSTVVDYTITNLQVKVHGFGATDTVTITIGATAMVSGGTVAATNGGGSTAAGQVPDLSGGKQNVVATGSITGATVTATGAVTYDPIVNDAAGTALSIDTGGAGSTTILRTGTGYGVHGLLANDAYQVVWNSIGGSITVGTFTATATGGIPIPGVQFTIPSDSSGIHILDIQNTGSYAIFGSMKAGQLTPTEPPFSSAYTTGFGDLLFKNIALLQASPSVAVIGQPEALSGSGLAAGGSYVVALGTSVAGVVSTTAPALAVFTATSTGSVPSSTSITLTDTPTSLETGTVEYFSIQTSAHFGTTPAEDAYAQFVLAASGNLNATSEPAGHAVTITAHALNPSCVYTVVFNYVQSQFQPTVYTGTPVGVVGPNSVGAGSASVNVPSGAQPGTYTVQLVTNGGGVGSPCIVAGGAPTGTAVLDIPLALTVGGTSGSCTNEGTACMGISGSPSVSKQGGNTIISATYTNNSNAPQSAFIYAVAHNALGQTVLYTTSNINPSAGGSATGQLVLFGLAPGTYSVSVFVVSSSGTALSTPTTVSVTI